MSPDQPSATLASTVPELETLDLYWRAANYLSVGQIYLLDNPLLREPLRSEHVKPRLLGHWGTTPGLNFVYAHMNRAILAHDLEAIFLALLVLISQNRLSREADRRALLDFQINLLAERESTKSLAILRRIARRLGVDDKDKEAEHLAASTNVAELAEALKEGS